jgi:crotonobetainyl-CoA:carnitine CoA-transferase CaiB-like acyl-CoA transferase
MMPRIPEAVGGVADSSPVTARLPLLDSCRIVEFGGLAPAAVGGHLADLGAEVIKIETGAGDPVRRAGQFALPGPEAEGLMHLRWNRGKRSVALDLHADGGAAVFRAIVRRADAVVEGARAGTLSRFGVGYEQLKADHPELVYCSVSGTGTSGPYARLGTSGPWFDMYAGLVQPRLDPQAPALGPQIAMHGVGVQGALAVAAGLVRAARTGIGSFIELSAVDVALSWLPDSIDAVLNDDRGDSRASYAPDGRLAAWPLIWAYETADGEAVFLAARDPKFRTRFFSAIDRPDLAALDFDQPDPGRMQQLWEDLAGVFRTRTKAAWVEFLLTTDVPGGPINSSTTVVDDPHFRARPSTYRVQHPYAGELELITPPIHLHGHQFAATLPPPVGRDSREILRECGFGDEEIADLARRKVVTLPDS